jgi:hypothetical protein
LDVGTGLSADPEDHVATGPDLRIGDSDREAVAALLREHYAEGRLTFDEFTQRLDATFAATTQSQLSRITRDLPHAGLPAGPRRAAADRPGRERSRQYRSAPPRGVRLLPVLLAVLVAWLLLFDLHLRFFFWPGKLVILLAVFAAARGAMRWLLRSGRGGFPGRGRWGGH